MIQRAFKPQILAFFDEKFPICCREHEHSVLLVVNSKFHTLYSNEIVFKCETCNIRKKFVSVGNTWLNSFDIKEILTE